MNNLLQADRVSKSFGSVTAVYEASLQIQEGEFIAILGRSGSGKSSLLYLLSGLESIDSGKLFFRNQEITRYNEEELALWRRKNLGMVFQNFNLIPTLSAVENVMFPLYPEKSISEGELKKRALEVLKQVGLSHRADHRPNQLSGGEQQRVAIARALINRPPLIIADEPTGNLDSKTGDEILKLFHDLRKEHGVALIIVTHDEEKVASGADRIIRMADGRIETNDKSTKQIIV